MNILFLTIGDISDLSANTLYPDLLRYFRDNGHSVYIVCQSEKRIAKGTQCNIEFGMQVIRVQTGNITKTNLIQKGISTLFISSIFKRAINRFFNNVKFDLILYTTPPITIANTVKYIIKRDHAFSFLMLKDIFPQNAVDIKLLNKSGIKGIIYKYFRFKEKELYLISDYIGCMSQANVDYLIQHNPYLNIRKVGICPNTVNPQKQGHVNKKAVRKKYNLPDDKVIFIYGGNFGKPQDVDYIIDVLKSESEFDDRHYVMCGSGTDFYKIKEYEYISQPKNLTVLNSLPLSDYSQLIDACDIGLIFLDHRFTIPNFPSRLLDYMNRYMPVLAATDTSTDLGQIIISGDFGWWCKSNDVQAFNAIVNEIVKNPQALVNKGNNSREYLENYFQTKVAYDAIMNACKVAVQADI